MVQRILPRDHYLNKLIAFRDNYPKVVLSLDAGVENDFEGVRQRNLAECWLRREDGQSLEISPLMAYNNSKSGRWREQAHQRGERCGYGNLFESRQRRVCGDF